MLNAFARFKLRLDFGGSSSYECVLRGQYQASHAFLSSTGALFASAIGWTQAISLVDAYLQQLRGPGARVCLWKAKQSQCRVPWTAGSSHAPNLLYWSVRVGIVSDDRISRLCEAQAPSGRSESAWLCDARCRP